MAVKFANNAASTLAAGIATGDTTLTIQAIDAAEFPTLVAGDFFPVTIVDPGTSTLFEIVYCTARSGVTLTVTRAQEGTTAKAFPNGAMVELRLTAALILPDAPATGTTFGRNNGAWVEAGSGGVGGEWTFNPATTGIGTKEVMFNNASQNSTTALYIMDVNAGNADLSNALNQLEVGSLILVQDKASPTTKWKQFKTTGVTIDNTSWHSIPVALKAAGGDLTAGRVTVDLNNVPIDTATPSIPATDYPGPPAAGADGTIDLNTILAPGWHRKMVGPSNPNNPLPSTYWYIQTLVYFGTTYLTQVAYPYAVEPRLGIMMRAMNNGTWGPWLSQTPAGQVGHFAMVAAPPGWLKANGALVGRVAYAALFAAIGTQWGVGDGSTTFALPDMRGEFVRSWDDGRTLDNGRGFGTVQGGGVESHTHVWSGSSGGASADHTHGATGLSMGTESVDHSHTVAVSGTTAGVSANHTHTFADNSSASGNASANHTHTMTGRIATTVATNGFGMGAGVNFTDNPQTGASGAAHTHTVAVAGTTAGNSVTHTHTFADNASATGGRSAGHTHAMAGSTAGRSADHTHTISGTNAAQAGALTETRPRNVALLACIKF